MADESQEQPTDQQDFITRGARLAVDVGKARVGVAKCDPDRVMATPVQTLKRDRTHGREIAELVEIARHYQAVCIYVGFPLNLAGHSTPSTQDAVDFANHVDHAIEGTLVRLVDERLTTVSAQRKLHEAGRNVKNSRSVIDQAAAVAILEYALDMEKSHGGWAGLPVTETQSTVKDGR